MANASSRFFWNDWRGDPCLRACGLAARGLWMEMLCLAAEADPIGYVIVGQRPATATDLARLTGASESEVESLLTELDRNGVFSRDRKGRVFCRRMVRDARMSAAAKKNGKMGGNPALKKPVETTEKNQEGLRPTITPPDKALNPFPSPKLEESKEEGSETAPSGAASDYGFVGKVIRLKWPAYTRWVEAFRHLDLKAELTGRDDWLATLGADDRRRKDWFLPTSNWLIRKNDEAIRSRSGADAVDLDVLH